MDKIVQKMAVDKETPNTVRFAAVQEKGKPPAITTLYIQKWAAPGNSITITVEEDE